MLYVSFCVLLVNLLSWQFDYLSNTVTSTHNTIEVAVYWSSNLTVRVDVRIVVGVSARVVS